jgi:hypothetical protein
MTLASATGTIITANDTGEVVMPLQSAFYAYSAGANDVTGNGTIYTLVFASEEYDQNSDWNGTSTFTAPVTGKYHFDLNVRLSGIGAAHTEGYITITRAAIKMYYGPLCNPYNGTSADGLGLCFSMDLILNASDTVYAACEVRNGTKVVDVSGAGAATAFNGRLVC